MVKNIFQKKGNAMNEVKMPKRLYWRITFDLPCDLPVQLDLRADAP